MKCCRNKEFTNFFCVSCAGVFHPSCMERCKDVIRLGGYRIYCSTECQSKADGDEQRDNDYTEKINALKKEISEKNTYIKRLKRGTQDFADDVSEAETKLNAQLAEQRNRIAELTVKMDLQKNLKSNLEEKIKESDKIVNKLETRIHDLTDVNKQMIDSIAVLEEENICNEKEVKKLQQQLEAYIFSSNKTSATCNGQSSNSPSTLIPKPQFLIMGDENARGLISIFKRLTSNKYDINCQWSNRKMFFDDRIEQCEELIKNFSKNDFILLFTGCFNAIKGKPIESERLYRFLKTTSKTNLLVCGPPLQIDRPILNGIIQQYDFQLQVILRNFKNTHFISSRVTSENGMMNYFERNELAQLIYYTMTKLAEQCNAESTYQQGNCSNDRNISVSLYQELNGTSNFSIPSINS